MECGPHGGRTISSSLEYHYTFGLVGFVHVPSGSYFTWSELLCQATFYFRTTSPLQDSHIAHCSPVRVSASVRRDENAATEKRSRFSQHFNNRKSSTVIALCEFSGRVAA
jgi:hypothetical protein